MQVETKTPNELDLAGKLRGNAAAVRSGAIGAEDRTWFAGSLERLADAAAALISERDAATARAEAAELGRATSDAALERLTAALEQTQVWAHSRGQRVEVLEARNRDVTVQRDAATAERDRLREALRPQLGKNARRSLEELAEAMEASGDAADATALRFLLERQDAARAALAGAAKETGDFPQPKRRDGEKPCGECHIRPGEICDICGAKEPSA